MTDQPGREPEQRLPARRPPGEPVPVDRFTAPPSTHAFQLSPERAARIVRQSANARWFGFLAVAFVSLFVIAYYFYSLGIPGVPNTALVGVDAKEAQHQQVVDVEQGYNLFEANCARCHGVNGEGGVGPVLNDQAKLFTHLNEQYLHNVLTVGGRYVCGNAKSLMPIWSNENGGPLNYRQLEELIAFLRAPNNQTYVVRDPTTNDAVVDPATGKPKTFTGWRDPNYKPDPNATPVPDCYLDAFKSPAASGGPAASGAAASAAASLAAGAPTVQITAQNIAFTTTSVGAPAGKGFGIDFDNQDANIPHNVAIKKADGTVVFAGAVFSGVAKQTYAVSPLDAGTYTFFCQVHPNMTGTLTVK